jgi:hypothetical protein
VGFISFLFKLFLIAMAVYYFKTYVIDGGETKQEKTVNNIEKKLQIREEKTQKKIQIKQTIQKKEHKTVKKTSKVYLTIDVKPKNGKAPLDVTLYINSKIKDIKSFSIDTGVEVYNEKGVPPKKLELTYFKAGKYTIKVKITDRNNKEYKSFATVNVN